MSTVSPLRRIGVLGDIHAEDEFVAMALAHLAQCAVDRVVAVGDLVDGPGDVVRCCRLLRDAGALVVRGNHERWLLSDTMRDLPDAIRAADLDAATRAWLAALPPTRVIDTVAGALLLCHGLGDNDMAGLRPDDFGYGLEVNDALWSLVRGGKFAFVVNGHTHQRMVRRVEGTTIVNAGTLYRAHQPCFAVVDLVERAVQFFDLARTGVAPAARIALPVG
jgi:predicted phosphodiesterase